MLRKVNIFGSAFDHKEPFTCHKGSRNLYFNNTNHPFPLMKLQNCKMLTAFQRLVGWWADRGQIQHVNFTSPSTPMSQRWHDVVESLNFTSPSGQRWGGRGKTSNAMAATTTTTTTTTTPRGTRRRRKQNYQSNQSFASSSLDVYNHHKIKSINHGFQQYPSPCTCPFWSLPRSWKATLHLREIGWLPPWESEKIRTYKNLRFRNRNLQKKCQKKGPRIQLYMRSRCCVLHDNFMVGIACYLKVSDAMAAMCLSLSSKPHVLKFSSDFLQPKAQKRK